jgi:renalase
LLEPCWAVALYAESTTHGDAVFCQHPKLRFVSHQATKTGRYACYILHFNAAFSSENIEQPEDFWFKQAVEILQSAFGIDTPVEHVAAHRWLYASQNTELTPTGIIALPKQHLWIGGDWSFGGRIENAYLAGLDLADSVIRGGKQTNLTV